MRSTGLRNGKIMASFDSEFRGEVAKKFALAIQGKSKAQAAEEIGVSRQALYQYLNSRATPKGDVLRRACVKWGITLDYRGMRLSEDQFKKSVPKQDQDEMQLSLLDALNVLRDRNLTVRVERKGPTAQGEAPTLELTIAIKFAG